jgi:alpha/beta superfamily hydrolase
MLSLYCTTSPAKIAASTKPKLVLMGDNDQFTSASALQQQVSTMTQPAELRIINGLDHFFFGHERQLATIIGDWLEQQIKQQQR